MPESRSNWSFWFTPLPGFASPKLVEAKFRNVVLADAKDADAWAARTSSELARFGERVDLLVDLEGLRVQPAASRRFGELRTQVLARYARHSTRFGPDAWTATSVNTSRVLHGADANIHPNRESALSALVAAREADSA